MIDYDENARHHHGGATTLPSENNEKGRTDPTFLAPQTATTRINSQRQVSSGVAGCSCPFILVQVGQTYKSARGAFFAGTSVAIGRFLTRDDPVAVGCLRS